jgi:hypothetical protein
MDKLESEGKYWNELLAGGPEFCSEDWSSLNYVMMQNMTKIIVYWISYIYGWWLSAILRN